MGYISAIRRGDDVLIWERDNKDTRTFKTVQAPYYFYVPSGKGNHTSMYGDTLERYDFKNAQQFNEVRNYCKRENIKLFESDIPPELKVLSDQYYNQPAPKLNVTFFDIEVDYSDQLGFASSDNPYAIINSVALYHQWKNTFVVLAVPPDELKEEWNVTYGNASPEFIQQLEDISPLPSDTSIEISFYKTESELLKAFLSEIENSDAICGWNSDFFDVPYVARRLEKIGMKYFRKLSFPEGEKPRWRPVEIMGVTQNTLDLSGRISCDYMVLFKKYEMAERHSYKLEVIADEILPDLPKLEYEGSLAKLYRKNFPWFIRYNLRDTEILKGFEERLGYVELANQMYHLSTGTFKHVTGTLKLAELATINYCHHELGLVVNDIDVPNESSSIQGAMVLSPQTGMHEHIGSIDIKSLYPSSIRSLNISPETIRGQFIEEGTASKEIAKDSYVSLTFVYESTKEEETRPATDWRNMFKERRWAVSGFGTVFDQTQQGIIPKILETWYGMRKSFQKQMVEAQKGNDAIQKNYFDKLQYVYKIKLNSFYGALTNMYFRFYDLRMGESTTGTGRTILLHQCAQVSKILDNQYLLPAPETNEEQPSYSSDTSVIYGDTDSTYFKTHATTTDEAIIVADKVGELVNASFKQFMQNTFLCTPGFDDLIGCSREIVSDRGIFVDKKRYILHLINDDGFEVDKLKVMGLDTKKTTLPKEVSSTLNKFIETLLKGATWEQISNDIVAYKDHLEHTSDFMSIGLPKGIKGIEEYTKDYELYGEGARLPGHVAAGIHWNKALNDHNDMSCPRITTGMKIKVFYLTQKFGKFKSIAVPVDIENIPNWFQEEFEPIIDKQAHIKRLVDNPLNNILRAINKHTPSRQTLSNDSILEF